MYVYNYLGNKSNGFIIAFISDLRFDLYSVITLDWIVRFNNGDIRTFEHVFMFIKSAGLI